MGILSQKFVSMNLGSFMKGLFNIYNFSINYCFNLGSEALACPNQMIFVHFRHCFNNIDLHRILGIMRINLSLNNIAHVVQRIKIQ